MKLLTKDTDYAVRALMVLAKKANSFVSSSYIAAREKIPLHYLRRILQTLKKKRIIKAKEGSGGGVKMGVDPYNVSVVDLMELFQGRVQLSECMSGDSICSKRKTCVLRRRIKDVEKKLVKEFEGITIGTLLEDKESDI